MAKLTWHKGPPPHVGWWHCNGTPAGAFSFRWWNGKEWSMASFQLDTADDAAHYAKVKAGCLQEEILWTDYWPKNARVPRIDPRTQA